MFRRVLLSTISLVALLGTAFAGDLPSRAEPPVYVPPPPVFTWTGAYIGGQIGYQWGTSSVITTSNVTGLVSPQPGYGANGVVGGAHVGYNYQMSQFVAGLEGDIDGSNYHGSGFNSPGIVEHSTHEAVEGSLRGRLGFAWNRALIYGTGGAAFGLIHDVSTNTFDGLRDTFNHDRVGWTLGGGIEYAVTNNWSMRAEYRYTDFGRFNEFLANSTLGTHTIQQHATDNAIRAGFSYKFDTVAPPGPVVAKY
jgi:outer membrane immunogenic protein